MISRIDQNNYTSVIQFTLVKDDSLPRMFDLNGLKPRFQMTAPMIAKEVGHRLGGMLVEFESTFKNSDFAFIEAARFTLRFLTAHDITDRLAQIKAAIEESASPMALRRFNLKLDPDQVSVTSTQSIAAVNSKYRGKVNKKSYLYDRFKDIAMMVVSFIDENECSIRANSNKKTMTYDIIGQLSSIEYHYENYVLDNLIEVVELQFKVREYVRENPVCSAFYNSIMQKDYSQALRRACADGRYELVNLLFEYSNKFDMNLDVNQPSLNGKTPLDYAIQSANEHLISLLNRNKALSSGEMYFTFMDHDYIAITQQNAENRARSMARNNGAPQYQQAGGFLSRQMNANPFGLFGAQPAHHVPGLRRPQSQTSYLGLSDSDDDDFFPSQPGYPRPPFGM